MRMLKCLLPFLLAMIIGELVFPLSDVSDELVNNAMTKELLLILGSAFTTYIFITTFFKLSVRK